jgi:putative phosphoesterase
LRIAAVSDIHVVPDGSDEPLLIKIKERVEELNPDVFVIAGDISDQLDVLSDALSRMKVDDCPCLFVAGNHDVWFEECDGTSSLEKYSRAIGDICRKNGFLHLPDAPFELESYAFVGAIGWYDYSFRRKDLGIPLEKYEQKEYRGAIWYDLFRVDWPMTDLEATSLFNQKLEYDFSTLSNNIKDIIYVSHHLPFQDLTVYKNKLPWDFYGAFMGATSTGQVIKRDGRVRLVVSGHSHVRHMISADGIVSLTVPIGYGRPDPENLEGFVKNAVVAIDLDGPNVKIDDFVSGDLSTGLPDALFRN